MFKQNFIRLCNEKGVSPTAACAEIGLSNATFSCWTDESVPRKATLMRIADYFGVTTTELLMGPAPKGDHVHIDFNLQHFASPSPVDEAMDKLTASVQQAADDLDKKKKPLLGLNPKLSALIDSMSKDELEDLEKYAEFILSKKKAK